MESVRSLAAHGTAREIERATEECWPSPHEFRDGWLLRFGESSQTRPCSAIYLDETVDSGDLAVTVPGLERVYRRHELALAVQIVEAPDFSAHTMISDYLSAERNYSRSTASLVCTADLASVVAGEIQSDRLGCFVVTDIHALPDLKPFSEAGWPDESQFMGVAELLAVDSVLVSCSIDSTPVGMARGARSGEWLGCFNFFVMPSMRRRGIGTAVMGRLAEWGRAQGATKAFLQVEEQNVSARRLYEQLTFEESYSYYYLVAPHRGADPD